MEDQLQVMILSNEKKDGNYIGLSDGGGEWHSEHSYVNQPTGYTQLHAIKVPKDGDYTEWTNMVKAYNNLSEYMKFRLEWLVGIHSFNGLKNPRNSAPVLHGNDEDDYKRSPPGSFLPIIRSHPHTGRKALYLSPRITIGVKDMEDTEAQSLRDELFTHIKNRDFVYHHRWAVGGLLIWDNRATIYPASASPKASTAACATRPCWEKYRFRMTQF